MRPSAVGWAALVGLVASAGCNQVLDIQDAHVDSTLGASNGGTAGTSSSKGGDGARSGASSHHGGSTAETGGKAGAGGSPLGSAGDDGGSPAATLCDDYCSTVMANCTGKYEQYRTLEQCVEVCKRMPAGSAGDENVNSVQCRVRQAEFSVSEPFVYCKSAGPLGTGKCGSNCESYCALMQATCTPESTAGNLEPSYYASSQACLEACSAIPSHAGDPTQYSSSANADPSCYVGNNVYCRAYHLTSALEQGTPDEHCPHSMGADPCNEQ